MPELWTCPQGHQWPTPIDGPPASGDGYSCPVCGAAAEAVTPPASTPSGPHDFGLPPTTGTPMQTLLAPDEPVRNLPGYEILGELGHGGMGIVYKARQLGLNRPVALKMILGSAHASRQHRALFRAEAEAVAQLAHPNIVQIYEIGEWRADAVSPAVPFFSLEYVDGGSLAQKLQGVPQPPRDAARLVETVARAMHYAHQRGIIHRDLKPANILLASVVRRPLSVAKDRDAARPSHGLRTTDYGQPKVADFGLAKQFSAESGQAETQAIRGTPSYMAPEQAVISPEAEARGYVIGPATDVYALGAILYEMLTGRPPFRGTTPLETLEQARSQEPVPPGRLQPSLPRDLETICLKCLQKDPRKRYDAACDLADDLERFLDGRPIHARPVSAMERGWRWCRRNPVVAGLAAAFVVALLGGIGVSTYFAIEANTRAEEAFKNAETATAESKRADAQAREAGLKALESHQRLIRLYVANGWRRFEEGNALGALPWFAEALKLDRNEPQLAETHRVRLAMVLRQCPRLQQVWFHQGPVVYAEFSPDQRRVVTASWDGTARVWEVATGKPVCPPLEPGDPVVHAAFSPDGRLLATASCEKYRPYDQKMTGGPQEVKVPDGKGGFKMQKLPGIPQLVLRQSAAQLWDASSGQPVGPALKQNGWVQYVEFSPDGRRLVSVAGLISNSLGGKSSAQVWDVDSGRPVAPALEHKLEVLRASFSPDGSRLVTASGGTASEPAEARIWDTETGKPIGEPLKHALRVTQAVFSPDGKRALTASWDQTARVWDATTGEPVTAPLRHTDRVNDAAFSPDGQKIVTAARDGIVQLWEIVTGERIGPPLQHGGAVMSVKFSDDGTRVLTASLDGAARLWELPAGPAWVQALAHEGEVSQVVFSPDGRQIITTTGVPLYYVTVATGSDDSNVTLNARQLTLWDGNTGKQLSSIGDSKGGKRITAFSADGQRLVTVVRRQSKGEARLESINGDPPGPLLEHRDEIHDAALSPDAKLIVTGSEDKTARIWKATSGELHVPALEHAEAVHRVSFSRDGRHVVTASGKGRSRDPWWARAWDVNTGQPLTPPLEHRHPIAQVIFSPDGSRFVTASGERGFDRSGEARVWSIASGHAVTEPLRHRGMVMHAAFSQDGRRLVTASGNEARVWDAQTGALLTLPLKHRGRVHHASFSGDGRRIVTASADHTARVWDAETGEPISPPLVHDGPVRSACFSPDGLRVVTAGADKCARVWDLTPLSESVEELARLAHLHTCQRLDVAGGLIMLEPQEFRKAWK